MRYLSIIRAAEQQGTPPPALLDAIGRFVANSLKNGTLVQTGGLAATAVGARVRIAGGKIKVIDGPFTESKEVIGGYAMLEAPTRQAAIDSTLAFLQLHVDHWPAWEGECELRELVFLAP